MKVILDYSTLVPLKIQVAFGPADKKLGSTTDDNSIKQVDTNTFSLICSQEVPDHTQKSTSLLFLALCILLLIIVLMPVRCRTELNYIAI
jgi:hypothetical protein